MKIVFSFGRINPPTSGHRKLVDQLCLEASKQNASARLYLSKTQDSKRNPLSPENKLSVVQTIFPKIEVRLAQTIFSAIADIENDGYDEAIFYCGADRYESFSNSLTSYIGTEINLKSLEIKKIERLDEDVSASKAREAAWNNDWKSFCEFSASTNEKINNNIFVEIRNMMGV